MARLNIDSYLSRRFDMAIQNCWHVTRDAWLDLTGKDLGDRTPERISTGTLIERFNHDVPAFERLHHPIDPCIVLMRQPGRVPHVGIYYRRKILQMTATGVTYMPVATATVGYLPHEVEFYR